MALTTLSVVLARLGLDDDSVTEAAIAIAVGSPLSSCSFAVSGGTLTATPNTGSPTVIDLTLAANDTMGELATALDTLSGIQATCVSGTAVASSLLSSQTINVTTSAIGQLTYAPTGESGGMVSTPISALITEVDARIARYCGRGNPLTGAEQFSSGSLDEYYDGDGEEVLLLRNYPITAVTSVQTIGYDGTATTLASGDYRLNAAKTGLHWRGAGATIGGRSVDGYYGEEPGPVYGISRVGWPCGVQNIRVQYTAGYSSIPDDLRSVATDIVCEMFLNRRANTMLASEGKGGARSVSFKSMDDVMKQHHHRLAPYRSLVNV